MQATETVSTPASKHPRRCELPGYRGVIRPITETAGPINQLRHVAETTSAEDIIRAIDLGLTIYNAGGVLFVHRSELSLLLDICRGIARDHGEEA